jgi:hypothetical protein
MSTVDETAMKFRKRAEEIRAEAASVNDPVLREKLLNAANALEEMAAWKPRNPPRSEQI